MKVECMFLWRKKFIERKRKKTKPKRSNQAIIIVYLEVVETFKSASLQKVCFSRYLMDKSNIVSAPHLAFIFFFCIVQSLIRVIISLTKNININLPCVRSKQNFLFHYLFYSERNCSNGR